MTVVIDDDPDVLFADGDERLFDRVRLLDNGYCHTLRAQSYEQKFYPPTKIAEVHDTTGDNPAEQDVDAEYVIDHGAEVWFTDDRGAYAPDTVALLPGGWLAYWYAGGGTTYLPAHMIDSVHTHTNDEQEAAGWFR